MLVQAPVLQKDGLQFRDLNRNGVLDPYEDWRLSPEQRARDLVARMTLEEKSGTMMHGTARSLGGPMASAGMGGQYDTAAIRALIDSVKVTNLITRLNTDPRTLATQNNFLQAMAERTRLGIPLTISTDPRNHFQYLPGVSTQTTFSQWPEALGFAAIDDTALTRRFGDIARQEYRAVGIHMALSPQADLATEPRWPRVAGTFGEDADLAGRHVRAYVTGFQHGANGVDSTGVVTVVKHWVGYGAARDGWDSHTYYGRFATFSGNNLEYYIRPFLGAFAAHAAGVMPTYSVLEHATWDGKPIEQVGAGFNRQLLTDMLRGRYGFQGVIVTDWAITWDCAERCKNGAPAGERPSFADVGMPWGVEDLPMRARFVKAVQAGVDEFGGTERADLLVEAVHAGELSEARLDSSVVRILTQKFAQGCSSIRSSAPIPRRDWSGIPRSWPPASMRSAEHWCCSRTRAGSCRSSLPRTVRSASTSMASPPRRRRARAGPSSPIPSRRTSPSSGSARPSSVSIRSTSSARSSTRAASRSRTAIPITRPSSRRAPPCRPS